VFASGNVFGPVVGGVLTDRLGWRWVFLVTIPLGIAAIAVAWRRLPAAATRQHERSLDIVGAGLLAVALSSLVLAIVLGGGRLSWSSPLVIGFIATAAVVGGVLVRWELRAERGVIPVRLLVGRDITLALLVAFITGTAIMGLIFFTPVFLQVALGESPTVSGLLMLPLMGGFMVSSVVTGRVITRLGHYKPFPIAGTLILAVGFGFLGSMSGSTALGPVAVYLAVSGVGVGMVMQVIILAVQNMVPSDAIGSATSVAQLFRAIGATVGVTAFGAVLSARFLSGLESRGVGDVDAGSLLDDPAALDLLGPGVRAAVSAAAADAVTFVFALAVPICLAALAAAVAMQERPLLGEAAMVGATDD
jgi:MFS family permease